MKKKFLIGCSVLFLVLLISLPLTHSQEIFYYPSGYPVLPYYYPPIWLFPPVRTSRVVTSVNPTLALLLATLTPAPAPAVVPTITVTIPLPAPVTPTVGVLTALQTLGGGVPTPGGGTVTTPTVGLNTILLLNLL
ncbi:MAG: hypothetical protein ACMUJM_25240 [bacterium]